MSGELLASVLGALEAFWDAPAAPESEGEAVVWRNVALRPTAFDGAHPARAVLLVALLGGGACGPTAPGP